MVFCTKRSKSKKRNFSRSLFRRNFNIARACPVSSSDFAVLLARSVWTSRSVESPMEGRRLCTWEMENLQQLTISSAASQAHKAKGNAKLLHSFAFSRFQSSYKICLVKRVWLTEHCLAFSIWSSSCPGQGFGATGLKSCPQHPCPSRPGWKPATGVCWFPEYWVNRQTPLFEKWWWNFIYFFVLLFSVVAYFKGHQSKQKEKTVTL